MGRASSGAVAPLFLRVRRDRPMRFFLSPRRGLPGTRCTTIHTMKTTTQALTCAALALALALAPLHAAPPPGILNHQGRIAVSGTNYTGTGFFKFALVDAAGTTTLWSNNGSSAGGGQPTVAVSASVSQGLYALGLGDTAVAGMTEAIPPSVFTGNADVRLRVWFSANGTTFEQLTPDRRITAAGYALSAGAVADPSFLGTTTNTPLDFSVNNQRGFRLQASPSIGNPVPNLIGGHPDNFIDAHLYGSVIGGGGAPGLTSRNSITGFSYFSVIGGGLSNVSTEENTFIGGGLSNQTTGFRSVVVGGQGNVASGNDSTVGGGGFNSATGGAATVPGGYLNTASGEASFAAGYRAKAIHAGAFVWADNTNADFSSTANNQFLIRATGGVGINKNNPAVALDVNGTVAATTFQGAFQGTIQGNLLGGATGNSIAGAATGSVIAGGGIGGVNTITAGGNGTIGGGRSNTLSGSQAFIGGGFGNTVSGNSAMVLGGESNVASGVMSFAAGFRAQAAHTGAFVWADTSNSSVFSSTADDQFNVRAVGGVRLFTGGTGVKVDDDSVVISGNAPAGRFGGAAGMDLNPTTDTGLLIEQGTVESSGVHFDGDSITFWSPGDQSRLLRILDEDSMAFGVAAAERFYVDGLGGFGASGGAKIAGNVGIGAVANPLDLLHIAGTNTRARVESTDTSFAGYVVKNTQAEWFTGIFQSGGAGSWGLFQSAPSVAARMVVTTAGNVGIGTTTPTRAKVEIQGSLGSDYEPTAVGFEGPLAILSNWGPLSRSISLYASRDIVAGGAMTSESDRRIKQVLGKSDGTRDLATLQSLEITDYVHRDFIAHGRRPQKKLIAQQVEEVFPQAVASMSGEVPDIFQHATVQDGWVELATDLKAGERVKLIEGSSASIHEVLEVKKGAFRTAFRSATGEKIFVYGRAVEDFRTVDYDAVAMLNVSATQELARKLAKAEAENAALKERLERLERAVETLARPAVVTTAGNTASN